jgi:Zn-dependent peptidase ImmA (M78 family)
LIGRRGNDKPPFSPYEFADFLRIKEIIQTNLGNLGAMLLRYNDGYVIKVNVNHFPSRQNFSVAHEIGHILLDELSQNTSITPMEFRDFNPQAHLKTYTEAKERLCDIAATELLMPEDIYKKYLICLGLSISTIEKLSNIFKVSLQASAIRTAELSSEPCMVIGWKLNSRSSSKMLRISWLNGPRKSQTCKDWYLPISTQVPYPSSLHTAYQKDGITKCFRAFKTNTGNKRVPMESKGFGRNETRFVLSLAFLSRLNANI